MSNDRSTMPDIRDLSLRIHGNHLSVAQFASHRSGTASGERSQVLIAESNMATRILLSTSLQREGYTVYAASTAEEVTEIIKQHGAPDLAILGMLHAGLDSFALASDLQRKGKVPILFLAPSTDMERKAEGLAALVNDYIPRPFTVSDVLMRVHHRLTQHTTSTNGADPHEVVIDERLRLNVVQQSVKLDNAQISLTPTEARLLDALCQHRGRVLSPGFLLAKAWDTLQGGTIQSLWVHIRRLRNKIEPDPQHPRYVVTVRGQGYCLPWRPEPEMITE
jgi:DNA-binding response OmpR family regulator